MPLLFLKLIPFVLIYILLLPFNLVASLVLALVWKPGFATPTPSENTWAAYTLQGNIDLALANLDMVALSTDGDGPKFLGLGYSATGDEEIWSFLRSFLGPKTIYRSPAGIMDKEGTLPVFSGDQLSGFLWALLRRYEENKLTAPELAQLKTIFDSVIFDGLPFVFEDANGKYTLGRGWVWTPWEPGHSTFDCLRAFLALLTELFPEEKNYKTLHSFFSILGSPLRFCHDLSFWWNTVYMKSWYAEHSTMLFCSLSAAIDPWDNVALNGATQLYKRYSWNPDISALYATYIDPTTYAPWELVLANLQAYNPAWKTHITNPPLFPTNSIKKFFSVRSMAFKNLSDHILSPVERLGSAYMWETTPLEQSTRRYGWTVDFLFLANLYQRRQLH